jgi:hypothetical protein
VGRAIADLHQRPFRHRVYHLSAGQGAETNAKLMRSLRIGGDSIRHVFAPALGRTFGAAASALSRTPRAWGLSGAASMMDVFWPYIVFDTVFDNRRVVQELGEAPAPFSSYASALLDFCLEHDFRYPHQAWPITVATGASVM